MKGMRKFSSPNEYGWLSYGITIQGKIYEGLGLMRVAVEKVVLNKGEDYVRRNDSAEGERKEA